MEEPNRDVAADQGRRRLLGGLAVGGAAVVGGVAGAGATRAFRGGLVRQRLAFDVANRPDLWREAEVMPVDGSAVPEGENRRTFCVEGVIYAEGTIPDGPGFVVTLDDAIGRWFCRGWLIIDDNRPEPHMNTDQQYFFGAVDPTEMFPTDTLMSSGVEGALSDTWQTVRAVTGGTGRYLGATGAITQRQIGTNTIVVDDFSGPNFRFEADLLLPA